MEERKRMEDAQRQALEDLRIENDSLKSRLDHTTEVSTEFGFNQYVSVNVPSPGVECGMCSDRR